MDKKFFCVRGYMKSGTNWVGRILKTHPQVDCVGEFHWETFYTALSANAQRINPKRSENYLQTVRPHLDAAIKESLLEFSDPDANWIGDRTPSTISPISIQDAPTIVIVRDFRDVIVSRMFHLYSHPRVTSVFDRYPVMQERLAKFQEDPWYFRDHPQQLLDNEEIVRNSAKEWAQFIESDDKTISEQPALTVLRIRYEDLHQDFPTVAKSMFEFIGADPPNQYPDRVQPGFTDETPNQLNRKGIVGDWKNYASEECLSWIASEAGPQMGRWKYN